MIHISRLICLCFCWAAIFSTHAQTEKKHPREMTTSEIHAEITALTRAPLSQDTILFSYRIDVESVSDGQTRVQRMWFEPGTERILWVADLNQPGAMFYHGGDMAAFGGQWLTLFATGDGTVSTGTVVPDIMLPQLGIGGETNIKPQRLKRVSGQWEVADRMAERRFAETSDLQFEAAAGPEKEAEWEAGLAAWRALQADERIRAITPDKAGPVWAYIVRDAATDEPISGYTVISTCDTLEMSLNGPAIWVQGLNKTLMDVAREQAVALKAAREEEARAKAAESRESDRNEAR